MPESKPLRAEGIGLRAGLLSPKLYPEKSATLVWPTPISLSHFRTMEFQLTHALEILRQTPATLHSLLNGLSPEWIRATEGPETWSPYDVIGHLICGEETDWIPRLQVILNHGDSEPFQPFDRVAMFERYGQQPLTELLDLFAQRRAASLETLQSLNLTAEHLELRGLHPALGSVTLGQLLATWVAHDLSHLAQISRVLAHQYRDAVGPWREYLSILK